jgi:alanyl-tRNA synthetase
VSGIVGGKVGGKGPTSQGVGQDVSKVDEAIALAEKWMREKLHL